MATIGTFLQRMQLKRLKWRKSKEQARQKPPDVPSLQAINIQPNDPTPEIEHSKVETTDDWRTLDEWAVPSEPGNERIVMARMENAVETLHLPKSRLEQLKTAVAEATMNAMEHGNHYNSDLPVMLQVLASKTIVAVRVSDKGGRQAIPDSETPDIEAKLAEIQSPRGWGLFLIKNMVDEMHTTSDEHHHTIELILSLKGDDHGNKKGKG